MNELVELWWIHRFGSTIADGTGVGHTASRPCFMLVVELTPCKRSARCCAPMGMGNGLRSYVRAGTVNYATARWLAGRRANGTAHYSATSSQWVPHGRLEVCDWSLTGFLVLVRSPEELRARRSGNAPIERSPKISAQRSSMPAAACTPTRHRLPPGVSPQEWPVHRDDRRSPDAFDRSSDSLSSPRARGDWTRCLHPRHWLAPASTRAAVSVSWPASSSGHDVVCVCRASPRVSSSASWEGLEFRPMNPVLRTRPNAKTRRATCSQGSRTNPGIPVLPSTGAERRRASFVSLHSLPEHRPSGLTEGADLSRVAATMPTHQQVLAAAGGVGICDVSGHGVARPCWQIESTVSC